MTKEEFDNFARKELDRCNKRNIPTYISYSEYKKIEQKNKSLEHQLEVSEQKRLKTIDILENWKINDFPSDVLRRVYHELKGEENE